MKFDPFKFEETNVNGIPLMVKNIPWADGYTYIRIIVMAGARHDPVGKEGLAHYFEHLPFNGCSSFPSLEMIREVKRTRFFDSLNAETSAEVTQFHCKTPSDRLLETMQFLHEFIFEPILKTEEIERERRVIMQEISGKFPSNRHEQLVRDVQHMTYGKNHPFGRFARALGWSDTVRGITPDELRAFHKQYYCSSNLRVVMVGDIDMPRAVSALVFGFDDIPTGPPADTHPRVVRWPNPSVPKHEISAQEYFGLGKQSVPKSSEVTAVRLLPHMGNSEIIMLSEMILWELLFLRLRAALGAIYSPTVDGWMFSDHNRMTMSLTVPPNQTERVQSIVETVCTDIANRRPDTMKMAAEVRATRIRQRKVMDLNARKIAELSASEWSTLGRIVPIADEVSLLEDITLDDISTLFQEQFRPEQLFWSIVKP